MDDLSRLHCSGQHRKLRIVPAHLVSASYLVAPDVLVDACFCGAGNFSDRDDFVACQNIHGGISAQRIAGGAGAGAGGGTTFRRAVPRCDDRDVDRHVDLDLGRSVDLLQHPQIQTQFADIKLAVQSNFREQGIGSLLLAEVEKRLKAKGCRKCYLLVTADNTDAAQFYEQRDWNEMKNDRIFAKEF